jgi:hypothetical protein
MKYGKLRIVGGTALAAMGAAICAFGMVEPVSVMGAHLVICTSSGLQTLAPAAPSSGCPYCWTALIFVIAGMMTALYGHEAGDAGSFEIGT